MAGRLEWDDGANLLARRFKDVRWPLIDPNHRHRHAPDSHPPAQRIGLAEQPVGGFRLEYRNRLAGHFPRREKPAAEQGPSQNVHVVRVRSVHGHRLRTDPLVLHPLEQLHPHPRVLDTGRGADRPSIAFLNDGPDAHFVGKMVRIERGLVKNRIT